MGRHHSRLKNCQYTQCIIKAPFKIAEAAKASKKAVAHNNFHTAYLFLFSSSMGRQFTSMVTTVCFSFFFQIPHIVHATFTLHLVVLCT